MAQEIWRKNLQLGDPYESLIDIPDAMGAELFPDSDREALAASHHIAGIVSETVPDRAGGIPERLDDDQVSDWLAGRAVRRVMQVRSEHGRFYI